ncbi:capsular polysaccharide transport system permease protein [Enhydrobacter aerosaccus]|uniref:Capsular polysaccharide transport system permease protein n=1 Tax=Enhydrobacter aerosaccus TaxID=225324 RepID=A0A1T4SDE9_9HYPH|nr:hypothetical protein [Enhydrobacter aerosaccus]SKA25871.1 capsular polysaccharide transport system permease protein [Enhydrobacter aerosaccus]
MNTAVIRLRKQTPSEAAAAVIEGQAKPPRTRIKGRGHLISFLLLVLLPTVVVLIYLFGFASDQYAAEFRFNLRRASDPILSNNGNSGTVPSGLAGGGVTASQIWDSQTIVQFIKSRDVVEALDGDLGFARIYRRAEIDWLSRLANNASIERKTEYWRGMVDPFFDMTTGVISVTVRAFSAGDTLAVATTVLKSAEKAVNDLSARARQDAIAFGDEEVAKAERDLIEARAALREFRDKAGMLDPTRSADVDIGLQARQRERLATMQSQYNAIQKSAPLSPQLRHIAAEMEALREIIRDQQATMTQGGDIATSKSDSPTITAVLGNFEALKLEEAFREKLYLSALQAREQSRMEALKQQLYLNAFVKPKTPEEALYPRRLRIAGMVFAAGIAVWALCSLVFYSIRDHL